jgi:hypothetical protein
VESDIDEARLKAVSQAGGGVFVRAADPESFQQAVERIAAIQKGRTVRLLHQQPRELFAWSAAAGLTALVAGFLLARSSAGALP